jgi:peptidoglycan/LPS O-acetylase OafA/YrhL
MHSSFYAFERLDKQVTPWPNGVYGVDIFFVISGFVMICSSGKLINIAGGWKVFAMHRVARIVPMYWLATTIKVIALIFTSGLILHVRHFSIVQTIDSYLFLPLRNDEGQFFPIVGVGWTLNFEMFFYLLFTLSMLLRINVYRFVGPILTLLALGECFRRPDWPAISFYADSRLMEFFFGMIIAKLCLTNKQLPRYVAIPLACLGLVVLVGPVPNWGLPVVLM